MQNRLQNDSFLIIPRKRVEINVLSYSIEEHEPRRKKNQNYEYNFIIICCCCRCFRCYCGGAHRMEYVIMFLSSLLHECLMIFANGVAMGSTPRLTSLIKFADGIQISDCLIFIDKVQHTLDEKVDLELCVCVCCFFISLFIGWYVYSTPTRQRLC